MSERARGFSMETVRWALLVGLLGAVLAPHEAAARQSPEERRAATRARAQAELDRLMPMFAEAQARWSVANAQRIETEQTKVVAGTDTIQVGPLRVMVLMGEGDEARPYFENAWAHYAPMLDGLVPEKLSQELFAFQYGFVLRKWDLPASVTRIEHAWGRSSEVQLAVNNAVAKVLFLSLPASQWAGAAVGLQPDFESVYREMVLGASPPTMTCAPGPSCPNGIMRLPRHALSESPPLAECRSGNASSCWIAMGATGNREPEDDIVLWYGENFFRLLATSQRCRSSVTARACQSMIQRYQDSLSPLGKTSRASLVSVALEMGGRGSLKRFIEAAGSPTFYSTDREPADYAGILSATAAAHSDQLMSEWLRRVQAAKPDRAGTDREARFGAYLWVLLFMALATRSSRWRLG